MLPKEATNILGNTKSQRITTMIMSIIRNGVQDIKMDPEVQQAQDILHKFMFENVYYNPVAKSEEVKAKMLIEKLYIYYLKNPEKMPGEYRKIIDHVGKERAVCDYISGMTDIYAINTYNELFIPKSWHI